MSDNLQKPELIECPYYKDHSIPKADMLKHLDICRENYSRELAATGCKMVMKWCNCSCNHYVAVVEHKLHEQLCEGGFKWGTQKADEETESSSSSGSHLEEQEGDPSGKRVNGQDVVENWEAWGAGWVQQVNDDDDDDALYSAEDDQSFPEDPEGAEGNVQGQE